MRLYGNLAMFLLLAWLAPRDSAGREKGRERKKGATPNRTEFSGKFIGQAGERCAWTAKGEKQYTLNVTCLVTKKGQPGHGYACEYTGEPALCPSYVTKPGDFWKQISRALRQQKRHLCVDARKTVRVRMCKTGPARAHFRLVAPAQEIAMTTPPTRAGLPEDTPATECTRRVNHQELARAKCGNEWASFCNFLFSMVQSKDC